MRRSRSAAIAITSLVVAAGLVALPGSPRAEAAVHPSGIASSASGDILNLGASAVGLNLANARIGHADASYGSAGSTASGSNIAATVAVLPITVDSNQQSAPPDNPAPAADSFLGLGVNLPGILTLDTGLIENSSHARYQVACTADGQSATSLTSLAGADIGLIGLDAVSLGASQVRTTTTLGAGGMVSQTQGSIAGLSLVNDLVQVSVDETATLTATATGSPGPATRSYSSPSAQVTVGGVTTTITPGGTGFSQSITVGGIVGVANALVTVSMPTTTGSVAANGTSATNAVSLLNVGITLRAPITGTTVAALTLGVLPMSATATAPAIPTAQLCVDAPVIQAPANGSTIADATPTVSGTGEPGATMAVSIDGASIGTTTVTGGGTWTIDAPSTLSEGVHNAQATQTVAGTSTLSNAVSFTVDTTPPGPPTIAVPADGSTIADRTPEYSGTGETGATVQVSVDGSVIGTAPVVAGAWSLPQPSDLADGPHTVSATQSDAVGNVSTAASNDFTIDATAPEPPVIVEPADGSSTTDTTPLLSGTAEADSTVVVSIDGGEVATVVASPTGDWSFQTTVALAEGPHTVSATAEDALGNTSAAASNDFEVDLTAPDAPVIVEPADGSSTNDTTPDLSGTGEDGATVEVRIDDVLVGTTTVADGAWTLELVDELEEGPHVVSATQTDAAGNASPAATNDFEVDLSAPDAPVIVTPADGSRTNDTTPTITGTGEAGATVEVSIDGTPVGTALVGIDSTWSLDLADELEAGPHTVAASQTDAAGNPSGSTSNAFTVDLEAPEAPVIATPADGSRTNDTTPTVSGTGEEGATVAVEIDGAPIGSTLVGPGGLWSVEVTVPLLPGDRVVTAVQTDEAGNASGEASNDFVVDITAPIAPVIEAPADGSTVPTATPTVSGAGEPGATVEVSIDGEVVGTAPVDGTGAWTLDLTEPLGEGPHTAEATQTDEAGNASAADAVGFSVDTVVPLAPAILDPEDGDVLADPLPVVSGTGEEGATIAVAVDGADAGTTTVLPDGTWSLPLTTPLADGERVIGATQEDAAGNLSPADSVTVTVDTVAPAAPVIVVPADGAFLADSTPTFSGTGEAGATVAVEIDGVPVGLAPVDQDGDWELTPIAPIADGPHTVTASQTDAAGNASGDDEASFTIDTAAPAAPVILAPADGAQLADPQPTVSGEGEAGATVTVSVDGTEVGTAPVLGDNSWSLPLPAELADGEHVIAALQTDAAGNASGSDTVTVTVDTGAPAAPAITAPADGSVTNDQTPTITGTGEAGATVAVEIDGTPVGLAPVDGLGDWSLTPLTPLAEGLHEVTATQTDGAGNTSGAASVSFEVDLTADAAPVIEAPADGSVTNDTTPTVSGTGVAGSTVTVVIDGVEVGTAPVDGTGAWSLALTTALAEGEHVVEATQTDPAGNVSDAASVSFEVDLTADAPPSIEAPADGSVTNDTTPTVSGSGVAGSTVTVLIDGDEVGTAPVDGTGAWTLELTSALAEGEHTIEATQTDPAGNVSDAASVTFEVDLTADAAPVIETPADGSVTNDTTPTVSGSGVAGSTVTVVIDGVEVGTAPVDGTGAWSLELTSALAEGEHRIEATQSDPAGNVSDAASVTFEVDLTADAAPVIEAPVDGSVTNDTTPTVSGTGVAGSTVTVVIDGVEVGTAPVDGAGAWSLALTTALAEGEHVVEATQTDPAGNVSDAASVTFEVDLTAPDAPVIEAPADGSTIGSPTPTISGTGEPGATVEVTLDGAVVGSAPVLGDGSWSLPLTTPLGEGEHTAAATQTDPAGNASESAASTFEVDLTAPAAPVIEAPADGSTIGDATPTVAGTGEPRATVAVSVDGAPVGTATVLDDGTWALPLTTPLGEGEHTATATQTDPVGNESPAASSTFEVDLTAPDAPVIVAPADGDVLGDAQPTVIGTGEAGATVAVTVDGTEVGTAPVGVDGTWTLPLPAPLAEGVHTIGATQTDPAGNESTADEATFEIDLTAPDAPVIEAPSDGAALADPQPTVSGIGEPGATVTVRVDGSPVGTVPVDGGGSWSLPLPAPLADGEHTIGATQADAAGNVSEAAEVTVEVDTAAPVAPVILAPADGALLADPTPTISGTGEPGATVAVTIDGAPVGDALVDGTGTWTLPTTAPLADGEHVVEAVQTDPAGNASPSADATFEIDATAPAAPIIEQPADGSSTSDTTPTISGTGEAGALVTVAIDGLVVGTAPVDGTGAWSLELTEPLDEGEHTVWASQEDAAGNGSPADASTFIVDTVAPAAPVIDTPANGSTTGDATPVIAGTGEPRASLTVTLDGTELGTVVVALDGTWSIDVTTPLAEGDHAVVAVQADAAGNASGIAESAFAVDLTAPAAPVILDPAEGAVIGDPTPMVSGTGEAGATVAVAIDGTAIGEALVAEDGTWSLPVVDALADGDHVVEAVQTDAGGNASGSDANAFEVDTVAPAAPSILTPAEGAVLADTTPTIAGTGEPGAEVEVRVDGEVVGTAIVGAGGAWSVPVTTPLAEGDHLAEATQTDAAGNASSTAERPFEIDLTAPAPPTILVPEDGALIADPTPGVSGTGEAGASVAVTIDGTPVGEAEVAEDGTWSVPVTTPLPDGEHTATAVQTDAAGNASGADTTTFEVDATAPGAPVITAPAPGETIDDRTPTIEGTGEPGATVEVVVDGEVVGTAPVGEDGTWELPLTEPLPDGAHEVEATQTDPAGNASPPTSVEFEVDGPEALPAPTITAPEHESVTNEQTPLITGTGTPGATVVIRVNGDPIGTAVVGDDGAWEFQVVDPWPHGEHDIDATQTLGEGTTSEPAEVVTLTVDIIAPDAPTITSPADGSTTGTTPTIRGTGEPGATVVVAIDGEVVGTVEVPDCTASGATLGAATCEWSLVLGEGLEVGQHTVEAWQLDAAGNASERTKHDFEVALEAPAPGPGAGGDDDELPATGGAPDAALLALGLLLLLGGAWMARSSRRRA